MKLRSDIITQTIDGTQFLIPLGSDGFSGVVKSNETAAFIVDQLKQETTAEAIADALGEVYDAPRETLMADIETCLAKLRSIGVLEE